MNVLEELMNAVEEAQVIDHMRRVFWSIDDASPEHLAILIDRVEQSLKISKEITGQEPFDLASLLAYCKAKRDKRVN